MTHEQVHKSHRTGWLRAAVLGANDGIVSTASLIIGVASASTSHEAILLAGVASMAAGSLSMAAGEYVSVSSQADTEKADLTLEKISLETDPESETDELCRIYESRGLNPALARQVAEQLMAQDALATHAREDIGITPGTLAHPVQAALYSAATFTIGALLPLVVAWLTPGKSLIITVALFSLVFLALLGAMAAHAGGASKITGALRVTLWGTLAMALTALVGHIFGLVSL
ncbi:VIT1/CCC1 transporter family protein [Nitrincola tapanii]|uniref:VIT family protein n=1 Tax=Nitrincola tapanii TaxID=1708751 RepID=A0A5A9W491_9GAMM|nr:VIT family protein [Nitrincola tapanii]KAA0875029.1 VIT family protein [Nitrincola tapanii]